MEREHEEAMRREFTDRVELGRNMVRPSVTDTELDQIEQQRREVDQRWRSGPHAEHWGYLDQAYRDWRDRPDTMARFVETVAYERSQGWDRGMTNVQFRSQEQACRLTAPDRARAEQRGQRSRRLRWR